MLASTGESENKSCVWAHFPRSLSLSNEIDSMLKFKDRNEVSIQVVEKAGFWATCLR
jgi:hypothetical protein